MTEKNNIRRLFDHFIISGLSKNPEELTPLEHECGNKPHEALAPITDIIVIFPGQGETIPSGFQCIETTPSGYPADLNHGSIRTNSAFLCYRRGYSKPPLVDIGIMDEGRNERPMEDSTVVQYTPKGRVANVCNTSSPLFFTYRRCKANAPPHQLVITHIAVVITNKGEKPPHTFYKIDKNLNKAVVGSDVYVCYKKTQSCCKRIAYKPSILDQFPKITPDDNNENYKMLQNVSMFCLPMGAVIESWSKECGSPEQLFNTCVLTDSNGEKYYGASLTFYEKYTGELTQHQKDLLSFDIDTKTDDANQNDNDDISKDSTKNNSNQLYFVNKSICIVSRYPFFECFRRFLYFIYQMSICRQKIPIERYISHLMYNVPFPTPSRPRVLVQLGEELIAFENFDDSQVPLSGAQFFEVLRTMNVENFIYVMQLALLEQKILIHSLRPWLLTVVCETICASIFPFYWQCPYVPQCPLPLAGVLQAPTPFIAGVDSRYFDLYEDPPNDVTCFDLDTDTVRYAINKKQLKESLLPKKSFKLLRQSLEAILDRIRKDDKHRRSKLAEGGDIDYQIQQRRASYELSIREAFLRYMCSIMEGYTQYLKPLKGCPKEKNLTDLTERFELNGFLKSRDKNSLEFYIKFTATQSFNRFIEERSFISDKVVYNAFFDECIQKYSTKTILLDRDLYSINHTIVVSPPELSNSNVVYEYDGFPNKFNHESFILEKSKDLSILTPERYSNIKKTPEMKLKLSGLRTLQEIKSSLSDISKCIERYPTVWTRILLFYSYSLWFMQLPSLLQVSKNKLKILRLGIIILRKVSRSMLPFDQVCYRLLMKLCSEYGYPHLALDVFNEMRRLSIVPNAITYAIYHWSVMEGNWPSIERINAINMWRRIRIRLDVSLRFTSIKKDLMEEAARELHNDLEDELDNKSLSITKTSDYSGSKPDNLDSSSLYTSPEFDTISKNSDKVKPTEHIRENGTKVEENDPLSSLNINDNNTKSASIAVSPSRERFLREHSTSPFAKELTSLDDRLSSKKLSMKSPYSWFKKITNSPVVTNLMRSQTTDNIKNVDEDSKSTGTNELRVTAITGSPSFSSLVNSVKKHAKTSYDVVSQQGNILFKKGGVNTFVKNLNKSYNSTTTENNYLNISDMSHIYDDQIFYLDNPLTGDLLGLDYWMNDLLDDKQIIKNENDFLNVTLCPATNCPKCHDLVSDEELLGGWSVDDSNLNTTCPYCFNTFAPSLKVQLEKRQEDSTNPICEKLSVPFVSPLVLRREIEKLLESDFLILSDPSLRTSHPEIFWNLVYFLKRLDVATHIYLWISKDVQIQCL